MSDFNKATAIKSITVWLAKGRMSSMLRRALEDTKTAIKAGDLNLAYQLTACKSFIVGTLRTAPSSRRYREGRHNYFRESSRLNTKALGNDLYQLLDGLHHDLAFALQEIPSGMMIYSSTGLNSGVVQQMQRKGTHPVIEAMNQEHAEIEEFCKKLSPKP